MCKLGYKFLLVILFLTFMNKSHAQLNLALDPLYELVFVDEFDSTALNTSKWYSQWYWGPNIPNTNKIKSCEESNVFLDDTVDVAYNFSPPNDGNNRIFDTTGSGYQRIISKREDFTAGVNGYDSNNNFTGLVNKPFKFSSAMMLGRYKFKYAYIEMRYRLSNISASISNAYGPNLWMWASDSSAGAEYSEIDIFEQRGTDWMMDGNLHYRKQKPQYPTGNWQDTALYHGKDDYNPPSVTKPYGPNYTGPYNSGNWHTVGCEWTPDHIDFYYDGNDTIKRFSITKLPVNQLCAMPLVVDIYMPAMQYCIPFDSGSTVSPFNYDIDYIKVYQVKQNCISKSFLNTSSGTYADTLWQDLTIGGSGGSAIFSGSIHHLAGEDFVLLQEGFEVSGTGTVIIDTPECQSGQDIIYNSASNPQGPNNPFAIEEIKKAKQSCQQ
jgi:hypothetical protein